MQLYYFTLAVQHERGQRNSTIRRQMSLSSPPPHHVSLSPVPGTVPYDVPSPLVCVPQPKYPHEVPKPPAPIGPEMVCETAAQILFCNINWAKIVPGFNTLPFRDQTVLLKEAWRELFILSAAEWKIPSLDLPAFLSVLGLEPADASDKVIKLMSEVRAFHDILDKLRQMRIDYNEYAYLRMFVLCKTALASSSAELSGRDIATMATLQDQVQLMLHTYTLRMYPTEPVRFGKLLLLLPTLATVSSETITDLFFRKTIGADSIERIINDMYKKGNLGNPIQTLLCESI